MSLHTQEGSLSIVKPRRSLEVVLLSSAEIFRNICVGIKCRCVGSYPNRVA